MQEMLISKSPEEICAAHENINEYLVCIYDGAIYPLRRDELYLVGREESHAETVIYINEPIVSRRHALIKWKDTFLLKDEDSKNGTFLNGRRLEKGEWVVLRDGDMISFAKIKYRYCTAASPIRKKISGGFLLEYVETFKGKKLSFPLAGKNYVHFQRKMIEENRHLNIFECFYVSTMKEESIVVHPQGYASLLHYLSKEEASMDEAVGWLEKILVIIKQGEKFMLCEDCFVLSLETVFINEDTCELKLIYLPIEPEGEIRFEKNIKYFISELLMHIKGNNQRVQEAMLEAIACEGVDKNHLHKQVIGLKASKPANRFYEEEEEKPEERPTEKKHKGGFSWNGLSWEHVKFLMPIICCVVAFLLFMTDLVRGMNLIGTMIIMGAINVSIFKNFEKEKKQEAEGKVKTDGAKESPFSSYL